MNHEERDIDTCHQSPTPPPRLKRGFAFLIDTTILGIATLLVVAMVQQVSGNLSVLNYWLGPLLFLGYFTLSSSRIGNGQSIGKKFFNIQVLDRRGQTISPGAAFFRSVPLYVAFVITETLFIPAETAVLYLIVTITAQCIWGCIVYMALFNRNTSQLLHDLTVKTLVVEKDAGETETRPDKGLPNIWWVYKAAFCGAMALFMVGTINRATQYEKPKPENSPGQREITRIRSGLTKNFKNIGLTVDAWSSKSGTFNSLDVTVFLSGFRESRMEVERNIDSKIRDLSAWVDKDTVITIITIYQVRLGLFSVVDTNVCVANIYQIQSIKSTIWKLGLIKYPGIRNRAIYRRINHKLDNATPPQVK